MTRRGKVTYSLHPVRRPGDSSQSADLTLETLFAGVVAEIARDTGVPAAALQAEIDARYGSFADAAPPRPRPKPADVFRALRDVTQPECPPPMTLPPLDPD